MKTKRRLLGVTMVAALALGFSAHAALVEGADRRPVQVAPGASAPAAAPAPAAPVQAPTGTPPL
ncbi:MAG TPA: hypothetical protein VHG72_06225, partial [Polyangia bacterium]|nr:hypothetical protein [Polyangia bacterium]